MALFASNIITSDSALGSAVIKKSLRFNSNDTTYLNRTPSSSSNRKTWTWSGWIKREKDSGGTNRYLFMAGQTDGNDNVAHLSMNNNNHFTLLEVTGSYIYRIQTTALYRDHSSWLHVVAAFDTTQSTASDRIKLYVNGVQITDLAQNTYPSQNHNSYFNHTVLHNIGRYNSGSTQWYQGYMAEINFVDGYAYDPSYFGFTDPVTNIWMPKRYEGTYGTNGFYLDFSDNSSTASLGIDKSPNGNDWTANNFQVSAGTGNDSLEDTPSNNFCTLNSNDEKNTSIQNGNLTVTQASDPARIRGTISMRPDTGKWYYEMSVGSGASYIFGMKSTSSEIDDNTEGYGYYGHNGNKVVNNSSSSYGASYSAGDTVAILYDSDKHTVNFYKNNVDQGEITGVSATTEYLPWVYLDNYGTAPNVHFNFGQRPFAYTPPIGAKKLNSTSLIPNNAPSIIRPQKHFECVTFTGNGSTGQSITSLDFQPDFIWFKNRSAGNNHASMNSVIGRSKGLYPDSNSIDFNSSAGRDLVSFDRHGFTVGNPEQASSTNNNGSNLVAWCWKAGGATAVSNSDGSITSSVSANPTGGFSIVTYTGTGSAATIGHGLGKAPKLIWVKNRTTTQDWFVNNGMIFNDYGKYYKLNSSQNIASDTNVFPNTAPTSTVFSVGGDNAVNGNGDTYVAYVWSEIPGFSQFGYWTGNGSTDGTYVYTGFTPRLIIYRKAVDENWHMLDTARSPGNQNKLGLDPNLSNAEADDSNLQIDFLSTGFKMRASHGTSNADGVNYFYYTWAGQPGPTPFGTHPNAR